MKNQRKFSASGLVTAALVVGLIFGGANLAAAQNDLTTSGAHTRYRA